MLKDFRKKGYLSKIALFFVAFAAVFSLTVQAKADTVQTKADIDVERAKGVCNYTVDGIDIETTPSMTLKVSYDDFFDKCYEEGERLIKIYLVVGAISELEGIEISEYKEEKDIYLQYQELENEVYGLFIKAETGF